MVVGRDRGSNCFNIEGLLDTAGERAVTLFPLFVFSYF